MEYTVLICDDDEDILSALQIYLSHEGYAVVKARDGMEAVRAVEDQVVHLIILDVMMPEMDGIRAAVKIRESSNAPILFLSAKSEDTDRVLGLNMGGDDYIAKPFTPVELLARVRAALRRYARLGGMQAAPETTVAEGVYQTGGLILDDTQKHVALDGSEITLTALEYNILKLLMSHMDRVFTSAQIYEAVWDEPAYHVTKIVSVHIRHIREKIEIDPKAPQYLKVIYGLGYKVVKQA
ncbi:MAG: response regulator transcription factor [Peptococcaceae bacterium]|jgi:DNA-binding response OmpR family regulator|nr:response regulator transcription factor [Peptococcaceae bacterium]